MVNHHHVVAPQIPRLGWGGARVCRTSWDTCRSAPLPVVYTGFDLVKLNFYISRYRIRRFPFSAFQGPSVAKQFQMGTRLNCPVSWVCGENGLLDVVTVLLATLCALKFSRSPLLEDVGTEVEGMRFQAASYHWLSGETGRTSALRVILAGRAASNKS